MSGSSGLGTGRGVFDTVRTEGGLLPSDLLSRIAAGDRSLDGLEPESYHLEPGTRLNEAATRAWNRLRPLWQRFQEERSKLGPDDTATSLTRERWLLPLFQELGYGRLQTARRVEIDGKSYPLSHLWGRVPIHLVGSGVDLDRKQARVAGAARSSPHSLVQEVLNRSQEHLWGVVSNGLRLRILRDNVSLTRQAHVEFDLEVLMDGEVYPDFVLLFLLLHESRLEGERPEECWLEKWARAASEAGTRALDGLRGGVEEAIRVLGEGALAHPANAALREALRSGALSTQDYYRQLLRQVYRLLFLFVAEDRGLLLDPKADPTTRSRYVEHYSTARLRKLAERTRGTAHHDLYQALRVVMDALGRDEGCPSLALPALGSFLWSREAVGHLATAEISNANVLEALRALAFTRRDGRLRAVDYRNLGSEELGSVYESLLELHPEVNADAAVFELKSSSGHERKQTGSYYTPRSLIQCLLDSALEPVLAEAVRSSDPERAILALKVCDPACGSGHFLIAAAHRIAKRLAGARTGEEEPAPDAVRHALRDVIGHCVYGVDLNPMAVELCKVSLWMEALEPGKPLSFLERRIQRGNSLLGATPALLAASIPDAAFESIEGDDGKFASSLKRQNKDEKKGQKTLFALFDAPPSAEVERLGERIEAMEAVDDSTILGIRKKEELLGLLAQSSLFRNTRLVADAWCAAFVWKKTREAPPPVTHEILSRLSANPSSVSKETRAEVERLAGEYSFFHWHIAFPDVFHVPQGGERPENEQAGWSGGFDVVLGNPPWERVKLQEKEWFAARSPKIAEAANASERKKLIDLLLSEDPGLHEAFLDARRQSEGESHFVRNSRRYPLCGRGDVNTYAAFAETNRGLISSTGRVGAILPSGIATDDTTRFFFQDLVEKRSLVSLFDFENAVGLFPGVGHGRFKFCLLTAGGVDSCGGAGAEFVFFARHVTDLNEEWRRFTLTADDVALLNPNTRTCPIFRSKRDAEITKAIYRRVPVLLREGPLEENPWGVSFLRLMDMSNDSGLFRTREQLGVDGWKLDGNVFHKGDQRYLPLYEAKMIHHFDHRFGDYVDYPPGAETTQLPDVPVERLQDAKYVIRPRYWVPEAEVDDRLAGKWDRGWLLGWRDITNTTNERTVIASVLPRVGVGNKIPLMLFRAEHLSQVPGLVSNLGAFAYDYAARQKIGGTTLNFFIYQQLPVLPPSTYSAPAPWSPEESLADWLRPRVLELTYTAWDLEPFARDLGFSGPPFRWDPDRRFQLRCELDAAFFHLYEINREDADYILDTFPIVRRNDEKEHGEYRTKRVILELYDAFAQRSDRLPFRKVSPAESEKYRTCVPLLSLKAAAGAFSDPQSVEPEGWAELRLSRRFQKGMFVAQVKGRSMEPKIPDGAWCLFQSPVTGTRQGKIVLAEHRAIHDPDSGGSYTVKRYQSEKSHDPDGSWQHTRIILEPLNPTFTPIELLDIEESEVRVIAEMVEVLSADPSST